jgi:NAD-dependent SIR2 family protein deacetylase
MTCTHCGAAEPGDYTLRFSPTERDPQTVELELCDECIERFLAEESAELVSPNIVATEDSLSDELPDSHR